MESATALAHLCAGRYAEAAMWAERSLGAGVTSVLLRVSLPRLWTGVLAAAFISIALVLGEYVFASLLNFDTLPQVVALLGKSDAAVSVAASLAALLFAFVLLLLLSFAGRTRHAERTGP